MLMIMNNLDPTVAQFPHELVTYGGNGSVFSNWSGLISLAFLRIDFPFFITGLNIILS